MCRCAPSSCARRSRPRRRWAASRWPRSGRVGLHQRRERGDLDAQVGARERAERVGLEERPLGPRAHRLDERRERFVAALRVALRLALRHGRLAEQVDGGGDAVLPQVAEHAERLLRRLADDEAVRHVLDAARGGGARAPSGPARLPPIFIAALIGGGGSPTSPRKPVRWRARSSRLRQAGTTSTKRNSAAFSSASLEASSIAFSSAAFSGLRDERGSAAASFSPTANSSCSSALSSTTRLTIPWVP